MRPSWLRKLFQQNKRQPKEKQASTSEYTQPLQCPEERCVPLTFSEPVSPRPPLRIIPWPPQPHTALCRPAPTDEHLEALSGEGESALLTMGINEASLSPGEFPTLAHLGQFRSSGAKFLEAKGCSATLAWHPDKQETPYQSLPRAQTARDTVYC